jgi:hypothetical protein
MKRARLSPGAALALASIALAAPAAAEPPDPAGLAVDVSPLLGSGAGIPLGWNEIVVSLQNNGKGTVRGHVDASTPRYGGERRDFRATAPFNVGPGAAVNVRVPMEVSGDVLVEVFDDTGRLVSDRGFPSFNPMSVMLLDVSEASRLRGAISEATAWTAFNPHPSSSRGAPALTVGSPRFDPATGDPLLAERAALYTTADAVLLPSDVLTRLAGAELDALAGYVLAGGTLAIAVARPEDVRHPTIAAFAGGAVRAEAVTPATLAVLRPSATSLGGSKIIPNAREPSGELAELLRGYAGGNLHGSLYGSSASYGLGEVHLLAFDPTRRPAVDDFWAQARVVDLSRRAFDRRSTQIFRLGAEPGGVNYNRVRRQLDPNEGSRWAIGAAAAVLLAYAVIAGPVNFSLAARAGRPLRALRWLPLFAAAAFALVLGIGVAAKGVHGRARHLTLVEAGAGMPRGAARRFRGFYASRAGELTVRSTDADSVLSTAIGDTAERHDHLLVDRDGARLVDVAVLPWQTAVVREDGFASLGDGIALVADGAGVAVINRTGRDLRGVIVRALDAAYYFPRVKDGDRVSTVTGEKMSRSAGGLAWEGATSPFFAGSVPLHRLAAHALGPVLDADAPGLADAWLAISDAAGDVVDWFPAGVPVLLGQLDGGEGRSSDAGLRLEKDRLLVRVVGYGGRP